MNGYRVLVYVPGRHGPVYESAGPLRQLLWEVGELFAAVWRQDWPLIRTARLAIWGPNGDLIRDDLGQQEVRS